VTQLARRRWLGKAARIVVLTHEEDMSSPRFRGPNFRWSNPPPALLDASVPLCVPFGMTPEDRAWVRALIVREWRKVQARHVDNAAEAS